MGFYSRRSKNLFSLGGEGMASYATLVALSRLIFAPSPSHYVRDTDAKLRRARGKQLSWRLAFSSPKSEKSPGHTLHKNIKATEVSMRYIFLARNS